MLLSFLVCIRKLRRVMEDYKGISFDQESKGGKIQTVRKPVAMLTIL